MLYLIIDGSAIVELSPGRTKELIRGQFVGELSFITLVLAWTNHDLVNFLDQDPVLSHAFDLILSTDVTEKLKRMNLQNTGSGFVY